MLQQALNFNSWCHSWDMQLNVEKTVLLRITRKKVPIIFEYHSSGVPIQRVDNYKYLGVTFTDKLTWNKHTTEVCTKAFKKLCFLCRRLRYASPQLRLLAVKTYVRSKLEYASQIWYPHTLKDIIQLEMIQRKATRFIFNKYKRTGSPSALMTENKIFPLLSRRKFHRIKFLHNMLTGNLNVNDLPYLRPIITRQTGHTRPHTLNLIFAKTKALKNSFFPKTIEDWNRLPDSVIMSPNFLQALEEHIFR